MAAFFDVPHAGFRSSNPIDIAIEPHPDAHRASDASRRMAAGDGCASRHPSRRPAPLRVAVLLRMRSGEFKPIGFMDSID
jgi:hypothetical protein